MTRVYLDHNATTPMRAEVREHLVHVLDALGGNPSSVHRSGRAARAVLDEARERAATALRVHEDEIVFTSGGTESVNLALLGAARARGDRGARGARGDLGVLLTSAAEHSAVLGAADELAARGWTVRRVGVDRSCRVSPAEIAGLVAAGGADVVSVMAANNEVAARDPSSTPTRRRPSAGSPSSSVRGSSTSRRSRPTSSAARSASAFFTSARVSPCAVRCSAADRKAASVPAPRMSRRSARPRWRSSWRCGSSPHSVRVRANYPRDCGARWRKL